MDILKVDTLARQKNSKRHFLKDIENSLYQVTHIGLEPHHFFLFEISQRIQSLEASKVLAKMGCGWQANQAMVIIFAKTQHKLVLGKW